MVKGIKNASAPWKLNPFRGRRRMRAMSHMESHMG